MKTPLTLLKESLKRYAERSSIVDASGYKRLAECQTINDVVRWCAYWKQYPYMEVYAPTWEIKQFVIQIIEQGDAAWK